jgi:hypothetical protein
VSNADPGWLETIEIIYETAKQANDLPIFAADLLISVSGQ